MKFATIELVMAIGWPPVSAALWGHVAVPAYDRWAAMWIAAAGIGLFFNLLELLWLACAIDVAQLLIGLAIWWWRNRRRRRRLLARWGLRELARLHAMLDALRDSLRPRQALHPAPGGAA